MKPYAVVPTTELTSIFLSSGVSRPSCTAEKTSDALQGSPLLDGRPPLAARKINSLPGGAACVNTHAKLITWLSIYKACSRNFTVCDNTSVDLDAENEVQPDMSLRKIDGACRLEENGYLRGPPELVGEI